MTKDEAGRYLAAMVAECVTECGVPLATFTGTGQDGRPDVYHTKRLAAAFRAFGLEDASHLILREVV